MLGPADLLLVAVLTLAATAVVAVAGATVLYALRHGSLRVLQLVVAVATVLATLAGVAVVSRAMLLSAHDLWVVCVVVPLAALAGGVTAWLLGRRVTHAGSALAAAAQRTGSGYVRPAGLPAELERISAALATTDAHLVRARHREVALERSRRELVAWVSHDLRTPLAGIRAMAEALEDGVADDPATVRRYHGRIRHETERLAGMVGDLFELSRIHAGSLQLAPERVGLDDLLLDAVAGVEPMATAKGVRLVGGPPPDVAVRVDVTGMGRVLRNLLVNAVRHTPSDGTVELTGDVRDGQLVVAVSDGCGGIPESDLPRVFEVAFRGEAARTPVPDTAANGDAAAGGAGLGLAIARGIVEAHAGHIAVANHGPGCRFVVRVPAAAPVPAEPADPAGPADPAEPADPAGSAGGEPTDPCPAS